MHSVFISTPCYDGMLSMSYTLSILKLIRKLNSMNIKYHIDLIGNESLIPRARNNSLGRFMKTNYSHLLFIDADIEFQPEALIDIINFNKDVVCCSVPTKNINWERIKESITNEDTRESYESRGLRFAYNKMNQQNNIDENSNTNENDNFIQVQHAGTAFMLIKREIIVKLYDKHPELMIRSAQLNNSIVCGLFCCMIQNKIYLSEDYSFCERVRNIGGEIWVNTSHNLNHIGRMIFRSDIANRTIK